MLRSIRERPIPFILLVVTVAHVLNARYLPITEYLQSLRITQTAFALVVVVSFAIPAWRAVWQRGITGDQFLIVGVWLHAIAATCTGIWSYIWRLAGAPPFFVANDIFGAFILYGSLALALHSVRPRTPGKIPTKRMLAVGFAVAAVTATVMLSAWAEPWAHDFVDWIRPTIQEKYPDPVWGRQVP